MPHAHSQLLKSSHISIRARRQRPRALAEALEPRMLMTTVFVTPPSTPTDATHVPTLQAALALAADGDTIVLQPGLSAGNFGSTTINGVAAQGDMSIRTVAALQANEIVTIGTGAQAEQDLVTSVTPTLLGDFLVTLASPLQFDQAGSPVDATNGAAGPALGINKGVTIATDGNADITLPYDLQVWDGTAGVSISPHIFTPDNPQGPPPPPPPTSETLTVTPGTLTVTQGGTLIGGWATFTDSSPRKARDFTATVTFADGSVVTGRVLKMCNGGFAVFARHKFTVAGTESFTVAVSTNDGAASDTQTGSVTVNPRALAAQGVDSTTDRSSVRNLTVATFTDNLPAFWPRYTATIAWGDGVTTTGQIFWNWCGGGFSVATSRSLAGPGTLTGTVTISTADGLASTTTTFTLTVTAPPPPPPPSFSGRGCRR